MVFIWRWFHLLFLISYLCVLQVHIKDTENPLVTDPRTVGIFGNFTSSRNQKIIHLS